METSLPPYRKACSCANHFDNGCFDNLGQYNKKGFAKRLSLKFLCAYSYYIQIPIPTIHRNGGDQEMVINATSNDTQIMLYF